MGGKDCLAKSDKTVNIEALKEKEKEIMVMGLSQRSGLGSSEFRKSS